VAAAADGRFERIGAGVDVHRIGIHQQDGVRQHQMALAVRRLRVGGRPPPVLRGAGDLARAVAGPQARL
jgi:hypothetical protein